MPVKMFSGASHFPWLSSLQELPDNNKNWKADSVKTLPKSPVLISYPDAKYPNKLLINSTENQQSLQLASVTSFELDKDDVGYFGLHHSNEGQQQQNVDIVLTMDDGSTVKHEIKSAKQGELNFTGFIADEGSTIKQVEINVPEGAELSVDRLQWGNLQEAESTSEQLVVEDKSIEQQTMLDEIVETTTEPAVCRLIPEVVQYQCDNDQWLFDVKVSSNNERSAWWCSDDEDEQCASYEKVVSYGYYSKSERAQMQLVFTDQDQQSCSQAITISLPDNCVNACSYRYEDGKEIKSCDVDGSLIITMREVSSLSLAKKK